MYEENLSKLLSFETKIKSDGSVDLPAEKLKKLLIMDIVKLKLIFMEKQLKQLKILA